MAITVEYVNGYEVLALPPNKFSRSVEVLEYRADLSDGFRQQALYGSSTGTRSWNLSFNAMRNKATADVTDGALGLSAAKYIEELWLRTKNSGVPFVIQDSLYGQYYLAEFVGNVLSSEQIFTTLFSTGLNLRQVRLPGVSVFDISAYSSISHWYKTPIAGAVDGGAFPDGVWLNEIDGGASMLDFGDTTYQTNEQNGLAIVRLVSSGSGFLATGDEPPVAFYEAFLVMKVREATFSHDDGIISNVDGAAGSPALLGMAGETKFYNLGFGSGYTFKKNGIEYAESNQQAPMNVFGLVHIRKATGWTMAEGLSFGKDRPITYPNRYADVDFGEIVIASELLPESVSTEITEDIIKRWGL